jgi:hypothetical protein
MVPFPYFCEGDLTVASIHVVYRYETETDSVTPMKAREADKLYSNTDARSGSTFVVEASNLKEALLAARCLLVLRANPIPDVDLDLDLLNSSLALVDRGRKRVGRNKFVSYTALRDLEADLSW